MDILTLLQSAQEKVKKKGFAILRSSRHSTPSQACIHTLGLPSMGLPDLVIYIGNHSNGPDIAHTLLNEVANLQIAQGKFTHGRQLTKEVFPDLPETSMVNITMLQITDPYYLQDTFVLNKAILREKGDYTQEALQLVYPDDSGRFPWEPGSQLADLKVVGRALE